MSPREDYLVSMRRVITAKLRPPPVPPYVVERPRLEEQMAGLFTTQRVVTVCATAGAGKTTAVLGAARRDPRALRWLTVDATERAPGRLLTYLEATVAAGTDEADGLASRLLRDGLPHAEVAGLLAEALIGSPALVVLDEVEHLTGATEALAVVTSFVRYAPPGVTVVLVSREDLGIHLDRASAVASRSLGEADLAFTRREAEAALAKAGHHDADAGSVLDATGGWVAGVMFEAWRSASHVVGSGGERDPFYGYLSQEILGRLSPAECEFLVNTSLVDEITPDIASALDEGEPFEVMAMLRKRHLPAVWSPDGTSLRLHTRFREYLQELLKRRGPDAIKPLRGRLAQVWADQGHTEEAVEEFLRAGRPRDADAVARRAIWDVLGRLDYPIADRWLSELERAGMELSPPLWRAALMSAIGQWQFDRGAHLGDQLRGDENSETLATTGWQMIVLLAWCYYHVARHDEVHALPERHDTMPQVAVVAQLFDAVCATDVSWRPPARVEGPLEVVLVRTHYVRGELAQVRELATSRWSASLSAPFVVSSLRAAGRTSEALALYEASTGNTDVWLHAIAYPEILIDLGHDEAALAALESGRRMIDRTGSRMLARFSEALLAKHALRLRRDPEAALGILEPSATPAGADGYGFITEVMECWRGHALLMLDRDAEALEQLERAVDHMRRGERALEMPTAAVYLSEARWRAGDEDGADEAADIALAACSGLGSRHTLLQALNEYPGVATRRMDAEPGHDSVWHEIARGLLAQRRDRRVPVGHHIELREFGEIRILVDGAEVRPRIAKSYELLAYVLDRPGRQARRDDLMNAIFDGRDGTAARTYLRQAILHLREALPREDALAVDKRTVALAPEAVVASQAQQFEILVAEGERLLGEHRTSALEAALAMFGRGEFFAGRSSDWINAKRARLEALAADARITAAETYLRAGQNDSARRHAEAAVRVDPYREHGWQILMRVAAAVGDRDGLISAYRGCRAALADVGIEPCHETRDLLEAGPRREAPVPAVAGPLTRH